jgi:hypothetical protein
MEAAENLGDAREKQERPERRGVKNYVQGVGYDPVSRGEEGVRAGEQLVIACGALRLGADEIRDPPGAEFAEEEQAIADPKPCAQPAGVSAAVIVEACDQTEGEESAHDKRVDYERRQRILAPDGGHVIQAAERNPIVQEQEGNVKGLKREESQLGSARHRLDIT